MENVELVTVKSPSGELGTINKSELQYALRDGYSVADNQEIEKHNSLIDAGSGINPLIAGLEAGASAASFGLSRQAENALGITTPEAQALREEANPIASGIGTAAGIVAPLVLSGGVAAPLVAGGEAAQLARAGLGVADLLNPVVATSKLGAATVEAVAPAVKTALTGLAETSPKIASAISKVAPAAVGGAVEGAVFGVGQSIDEDALGDPDALGEHLVSNIGLSALAGGALGGLFAAAPIAYDVAKSGAKKVVEPIAEKINALLPWQKAAVESGDLAASIKVSEFPQSEELLEKLKNFRTANKDADATQLIGQERGWGSFPEQLTDDVLIKKGADWLVQGQPTVSSLTFKTERVNAIKKIEQDLTNNIKTTMPGVSEAEAGNMFKESLNKEIQTQYAPLEEAYRTIDEFGESLLVSDRSKNAIARNFLKDKNIRLGLKTPEAQMYRNVSDAIVNAKDINDIRFIRTKIAGSVAQLASGGEREAARVISERLTNMEENIIRRFAKNEMKTPQAKAKILSLLDQIRDTKSQYREFAQSINELTGGIGKSVKGAKTAQAYIENMNPQTIIKRAFNKNDVEFTQFLKDKFPAQFQIAKDFKLSELKSKVSEAKNPIGKAIKEFDSMSKEVRDLLFSKEEQRLFTDAKAWLSKLPERMNPSGTAYTNAFADAFSGIEKSMIANSRDFAISEYIGGASKSIAASEGQQKIGVLAKIKDLSNKGQKSIESSSKQIFSGKGTTASIGAASALISSNNISDEEATKVMEKIDRHSTDPEALMNAAHETTKNIYPYAPGVSAGMQKTLVAATSFLSSKVPKQTNQKILSPKYKIPKSEMIKFKGYLNTIKQPSSVLKGIKQGMVTPDQMETLRAVYPEMLSQMQMAVTEQLAEHLSKDKDLPYQTKLGLSAFLERDLVSSLEPMSIMMNQTTPGSGMTGDEKQTAVKTTQKGLSQLNESGRVKTNLQSISSGDEA